MSQLISKFTKPILSTACIFALSGCLTINAKSLDFEETRNLSVPMGSANVLEVDAAAGFLRIVGDDSIQEVQVTADILAHNDDIKLRLDAKGDRIELEADANHNSNYSWGRESPKIDLTVRVPSGMKLKIKDGSGSINIKNINNDLSVDDGSGSMEISNIKGNLDIEDGSGSLTISVVDGNIVIDDGSGSLSVEQVTGTLDIDDGSGGLDVYDVGGLVTIDDGSGGITVKKLKNGLTIIEEGSGGLKMTDIQGPVSIK